MKRKLIYLDNAATSHFKPKSVVKSVIKCLKTSANPGRSGHYLSLKNAFEVLKTRQDVANFFGIEEPENVIFTKNCTEALNLVILGCVNLGGNVVASCFEHNSVLRPLFELERQEKITLTIITPKNKSFITKSDVEENVISKTFLVCITHISNVTGNKNDAENIAQFCRKKNILFLLDCAQSAGHLKIDMKKQNIDFLCFAGHKGLFSTQGIGGLCINTKTLPLPTHFGGTGSESESTFQPLALPERLECGTLSTPCICGLKSGVNYVNKNFDKIIKKIENLTNFLIEKLSNIKNISIYTNNNSRFGVVSFNLKDVDSIVVSDFLNSNFNIATRGGLHCAPLAHQFLNTLKTGAVRVSLNHKNNKRQLKILIDALTLLNEKKDHPLKESSFFKKF